MTDAKTYLCYLKSTRPTGRVMAKELGVSSFGIRRPTHASLDVLIRWGSCADMPPAGVVINHPEAIANASHKLRAIQLMRRAGVHTVPAYQTWEEASREAAVIFGRSFRGFGGRDIVVYKPHSGEAPQD